METFPALLAFCVGNSPVTGEFPAQRPVTRSFDVFYDLRLNKRLAGDLKRNRAHYNVIAMLRKLSIVDIDHPFKKWVNTGKYDAFSNIGVEVLLSK